VVQVDQKQNIEHSFVNLKNYWE